MIESVSLNPKEMYYHSARFWKKNTDFCERNTFRDDDAKMSAQILN